MRALSLATLGLFAVGALAQGIKPLIAGKYGCDEQKINEIRSLLQEAQTYALAGTKILPTDALYIKYFNSKVAVTTSDVNYKRIKKRYDFVYSLLKAFNDGESSTSLPSVTIRCDAPAKLCVDTMAFVPLETPEGKGDAIYICPSLIKQSGEPTFKNHAWFTPGLERFEPPTIYDGEGVRYNACKGDWPTDFEFWSETLPVKSFIHELFHIRDRANQRTVDCVYGAFWCAFVARYSPSTAVNNADSYAMYAVASRLAQACKIHKVPKVIFHQRDHIPEYGWSWSPTASGSKFTQPIATKAHNKGVCKVPNSVWDWTTKFYVTGTSATAHHGKAVHLPEKGEKPGSSLLMLDSRTPARPDVVLDPKHRVLVIHPDPAMKKTKIMAKKTSKPPVGTEIEA